VELGWRANRALFVGNDTPQGGRRYGSPRGGSLRSARRAAEERLAELVENYQRPAPKLAEWMEANVPERLDSELRRRTRVATPFPNEASLFRIVSALAAEISEDWETGRIYLNPEGE